MNENGSIWLIGGVALFTVLHLTSALFPGGRKALQSMLGKAAYRGAFAVLSIAGLVLIVIGWRNTVPVVIYAPPAWGPSLTFFLMFVAILLIGASHATTSIKRYVRHPQLNAVLLWSAAHLLANGDIRSIILFASLGAWSMLEMTLINRRDGDWVRPPRASARQEMIGAAISLTVFLVLIALHPYFAGVSPLPG